MFFKAEEPLGEKVTRNGPTKGAKRPVCMR